MFWNKIVATFFAILERCRLSPRTLGRPRISDDTSSNSKNGESVSTPADEENDDSLNEYRAPTSETCLQSAIPNYPITVEQNDNVSFQGNEVYAIAPGESKHPVSHMADKQCEELAFPVLFPKGKYGYSVNREIKLPPVTYFNARLTCKLHHSGRIATNPIMQLLVHSSRWMYPLAAKYSIPFAICLAMEICSTLESFGLTISRLARR